MIGAVVCVIVEPKSGVAPRQVGDPSPERGINVGAISFMRASTSAALACPTTPCLSRIPISVLFLERQALALLKEFALPRNGPCLARLELRFDRDTGSIFVISCDDPACAQARMGQPVREVSPDYSGRAHRDDTALVVRADGLPLIAYRDVSDGAIKLLDCHTRECSRADTATLSEPGHNTASAMALDRDGRALVAYQDLDRERIVIAACSGTRCTRTPVTTIQRGGGDGLAMALDGHGGPMIAWMDVWNDWDLVVTTPLNLP
ncbi:hypothetical protein [Nonomuraea sp. NEAU-A123]|uniref:hypothetical protein n=1 Tax=Nonomuraea sp. NEAU-A123 TaxID=2839649 RepID=UPI001BE42456|nr:hypothetical protein [Nonomuraea sp. NEAU-A123]MBT2229765.1 hypothetical protein [Nonomuraea sp. NEAU-A123]